MIRIALLLVAAPFAAAADYEARTQTTGDLPKSANKNYKLLTPPGAGPHPLVIYLHGAGAKGNDNAKPLKEPLPALLAKAEIQKQFPCYVLVPQCVDGTMDDGRPFNWVNWKGQKENVKEPAKWVEADAERSDQLQGAMLALNQVLHLEKGKVDHGRIYLTGVSMGGSGAVNWAARDPKRFAAALAACGLSETAKAKELAGTPLALFHGTDDPQVPFQRTKDLAAAVKAAGGTVTFTEYAGAGHNIAPKVFTENDHAVLKWLFAQKREGK